METIYCSLYCIYCCLGICIAVALLLYTGFHLGCTKYLGPRKTFSTWEMSQLQMFQEWKTWSLVRHHPTTYEGTLYFKTAIIGRMLLELCIWLCSMLTRCVQTCRDTSSNGLLHSVILYSGGHYPWHDTAVNNVREAFSSICLNYGVSSLLGTRTI